MTKEEASLPRAVTSSPDTPGQYPLRLPLNSHSGRIALELGSADVQVRFGRKFDLRPADAMSETPHRSEI